jgi:GNAT superfamily N-acetyltransferase
MTYSSPITEISVGTNPQRYREVIDFMDAGIFSTPGEMDYGTRGRVFAIEDTTGEVLAAGKLDPITATEYLVGLLYRSEESRGRGLGTLVLAHLEDVAREAGADTIEVTAVSDKSEDFFRKRGYDTCTIQTDMGFTRSDLIKALRP